MGKVKKYTEIVISIMLVILGMASRMGMGHTNSKMATYMSDSSNKVSWMVRAN